MASSLRKILVVGATGQQGGAVLSELSRIATTTSKSQFPNLKVLALTRKASSKGAQALVPKYGKTLNLEVVEGDSKNPGPIFAAHKDIDTVFSYTIPPVKEEEDQGKPLVTAAAQNGVKHFIFSSVERGGDERSWDNPTDVPHFITKHNVELHLRKTCMENPSMKYTILRPVAFMDNFNPTSRISSGMAAMWATMPSDTKLQLVSVHDIGVFAAKAILRPEDYANRAVGLAGDELTLAEVRSIFRRVSGTQLPQSWTVVGHLFRWLIADVGHMFTFFEKEGYHADIEKLRAEEPKLQNFETWLKESSTFDFGKGSKE